MVTVELAGIVSSFENEHGQFDVHRGVPEQLLGQLILKSREPHIMKWTPRDAAERFTNPGAVRRHLDKGRSMYLLAQDENLAGTIWYGAQPFPTDEFGPQIASHTFALRTYQDYLRRGLTKPFMTASLTDYVLTHANDNEPSPMDGIWACTTTGNVVEGLNLKYGYNSVGRTATNAYMVLSTGKIQEIVGA